MDRIQVAIIEDEQVHMELLEGYLKEWSNARGREVAVFHFPDAESFLFQWEDVPELSVLFVDIQMKKMNGMEMARKVRERNREIALVFTTGITDYIEEGYEVEALHYLVKPIRQDKVSLCMDKVLERSKNKHYILVNGKSEVYKLSLEEIDYVEAMGHGTRIVLEKGRELECTDGFSELEATLRELSFIKTHRSYLCNLRKVHHIDKASVYFDDGNVIPVSRRLYNEVNRAFIRHYRGEMGQ